MQLLTPGFYNVFSGTLDQGIFSKEPFQKVRAAGFHTDQHRKIHNVNFSERNVATLLSLCQEDDRYASENPTDLNSASIRFSQLAGIDCHHHWGRISLAKLKNDRGITLVDSEPKIVTTLGDLSYQQRLNSFFKENSRQEVVHPAFVPKGMFDPEKLAAAGWEYAPQMYDNEEEAQLSLQHVFNRQNTPNLDEQLRMKQYTAKDAISSNLDIGIIRMDGFKKIESLPHAPAGEDKIDDVFLEKLVIDVRKLHESSLLTLNDQPQKAAVVKLAGYHDYLLTTFDNIDTLKFKPLPDHELLSYFRDSWPEHLRQIDSREFTRNTLPTLGKILPAVDKNYQLILDFIDMICSMGKPMIRKIEHCNINRIKERMIEFQQLYRELALIQKQIEFFQTLEEVSQQETDALHDNTWRKYLTYPAPPTPMAWHYMPRDNTHTFNSEQMNTLFKGSFIPFLRKEKEKAISRLKVLDRKLSIAKLKIGIQSDLEKMLLTFTGKSISLKHSAGNEDLRSHWDFLSTLSNEILALIAANKLTSNNPGSQSPEYLDLATDFCPRPAGDLKPASQGRSMAKSTG